MRARGREPENQCEARFWAGRQSAASHVASGHTISSRAVGPACWLVSDREADEQEHGECLSEIGAVRALLDTSEAASRLTRQPACANAWRGAGAAWKARERRGLSTGHDSFAGVACVGAAGDGGGGQQERSVEVAKPHRKGRWRGTWLLSKFREQRGVFVARGITVSMTDPGCAWEGVSMNRDSSAGAVHGPGTRGTSVGIVNHGRAGDSRQDDSSAGGLPA
jgi:hypothetical protein